MGEAQRWACFFCTEGNMVFPKLAVPLTLELKAGWVGWAEIKPGSAYAGQVPYTHSNVSRAPALLFLFFGHNQVFSGLTSGSTFRDNSYWVSGGPKECQELNVGQLHAKQTLYMLYCLSSPSPA